MQKRSFLIPHCFAYIRVEQVTGRNARNRKLVWLNNTIATATPNHQSAFAVIGGLFAALDGLSIWRNSGRMRQVTSSPERTKELRPMGIKRDEIMHSLAIHSTSETSFSLILNGRVVLIRVVLRFYDRRS